MVIDRLAATQHSATGKWASQPSLTMLPWTVAQLHLPEGRHTKWINGNIQYVLWKDSLEKYIHETLNLHDTHNLVDWEALGRHHRSLLWKCWATRINMIFRWAPKNARKFLTRQLDTPLCPLCNSTEETVAHMRFNARRSLPLKPKR